MKFKLTVDKNAEEKVTALVHERSEFTEKLETLVSKYNGTDRVTAYTEDDIKVLIFSDIECVTVINGKTFAVDKAGDKYNLKLRLYEIEQMLPASFIKINKSSIANRGYIVKFSAVINGSVNVVFKSGYTDYVSRRCFAQIKKELKTK
ncbi:MAG: LytTR family transcriptional regulator [Ruminococcus sp.]|nr:LytTR family transcriptional regulator [Ruminococcus sp.]